MFIVLLRFLSNTFTFKTCADNVGIEDNKVEHIVVITNGKAGPDGGKQKDVKFEKCKDIWLAKNIQITQIPTTHRNHAYELVRDMDMTGVDVVVCVGGDGTIHEVINGWCAREDKHEGEIACTPSPPRKTLQGALPPGAAARRLTLART